MQLMNFLCGTTSRQALGAQPRRTSRRVPVRAAHQRAPDRWVPPQPGQCRRAAVTTQRAHQRHCRHAMQARSAAVLVTAVAAPPPPPPPPPGPQQLYNRAGCNLPSVTDSIGQGHCCASLRTQPHTTPHRRRRRHRRHHHHRRRLLQKQQRVNESLCRRHPSPSKCCS